MTPADEECAFFFLLLLDPSLYYGGGECRSARFFSRFIALQIQKESLGYPLQPYLEGRK